MNNETRISPYQFTHNGDFYRPASHQYIKSHEQIGENDRALVGGKALNLAIMANNGIAVPDAVYVTTEAHDNYLEEGAVDSYLISELEHVRDAMGGSIAVRSSATCEDGADVSMAGVFDTYYLFDSTQDTAAAIQAIYEQSHSQEVKELLRLHRHETESVRMGIIVQRLVAAEQSGVLYTDVAGNNTLVQYVNGLGADLVDGIQEGSSILLDDKGAIKQSKGFTDSPLTDENVEQLHTNAQTIKELFGTIPQDIEFAIEDGVVHILQARPLTTEIDNIELRATPAETLQSVKNHILELITAEKHELGSERVTFSDSNFSEIIPRPKEMDIGVFSYIFTGSDGIEGAIQKGRKEMGYPLGDESVGYMHFIGGKPYFSVAGDAHTFYAGFPEDRASYNASLVAEYLQAVEANPEKGNYPEMGLYLQDPTLEELQDRFDDQAETYYSRYVEFRDKLAGHADTFLDDYQQSHLPAELLYLENMAAIPLGELEGDELQRYLFDVLEHLRNESCVNFVKAARLGFYYSQRLQHYLEQELGTDHDHTEDLFSKLTQGLDGSEITDANLAIASAVSLEEAMRIGRTKVGHYSSGEMLEIRHPRLSENDESLQAYVEGIYHNKDQYISEFAKQQQARLTLESELRSQLTADKVNDFDQILSATQTYMALRETAKYYFVAEYGLARNALLHLSDALGLQGDEIFSVYPRELPEFASNPEHYSVIIDERQQAFANYQDLDMPSVIREQDVDTLGLASDKYEYVKEMAGKLLAQGALIASGIIVNIDEYDDPKEAMKMIKAVKADGSEVILVASQMNLSHDPLIVAADGIVIENAGLVSHGAQRARELGRGAIGGIKSRYLKTGERVNFDPENRIIIRGEEKV